MAARVKKIVRPFQTDKELLSYALKNYPIGTRFIDLHQDKERRTIHKVCSTPKFSLILGERAIDDTNYLLYYKGEWAQIVMKTYILYSKATLIINDL